MSVGLRIVGTEVVGSTVGARELGLLVGVRVVGWAVVGL